MAITIILICLVIQRWLEVDHYERPTAWFIDYYRWMMDRFGEFSWGSGWGGVFILIAPPVLLFVIIAVLIYQLSDMVGYYLLTLLVCWYALDARPLTAVQSNTDTVQAVLINAYHRMFAIIFWLLVLGSTGVVLYLLITYLCRHLDTLPEDQRAQTLLPHVLKVQAVLDWIPLRLLGITFALIGQFMPTITFWYKHLLTGLDQSESNMVACARISLGTDKDQLSMLEGLVNRALLVWLVVIALFTLGRWLG